MASRSSVCALVMVFVIETDHQGKGASSRSAAADPAPETDELDTTMVLVRLASMEYASRLFNEAWERHHRRQRVIAWIGSFVCLGAIAAFYLGARDGEIPPLPIPAHPLPGAITVSPSAILSRPPVMGVRCGPASANACDVGLAVWLKRPARSVRAAVDGREFTMTPVGHRLVSYGRSPNEYDGFFLPAQIGKPQQGPLAPYAGVSSAPLHARLWLLIDDGPGHSVITRSHVRLMSGWG
jgi:hypothetical protein